MIRIVHNNSQFAQVKAPSNTENLRNENSLECERATHTLKMITLTRVDKHWK